MPLDHHLETLYKRRFGAGLEFRRQMWRVLYERFFARYIPADAVVMEIGAGYCEFINAVRAARKIAVDLNPDTKVHANEDVQVLATSSVDLSQLPDHSIDIAFASNFFEHLTREDIVRTMAEVRRVLRPTGRFLVLQPNIRYCARDYWMFFDHITPLDDRSLAEVLELHGFGIEEMIVRFLPYSTQGRLPSSLALVRLYLRLRWAWRFFGQQSFAVARIESPLGSQGG